MQNEAATLVLNILETYKNVQDKSKPLEELRIVVKSSMNTELNSYLIKLELPIFLLNELKKNRESDFICKVIDIITTITLKSNDQKLKRCIVYEEYCYYFVDLSIKELKNKRMFFARGCLRFFTDLLLIDGLQNELITEMKKNHVFSLVLHLLNYKEIKKEELCQFFSLVFNNRSVNDILTFSSSLPKLQKKNGYNPHINGVYESDLGYKKEITFKPADYKKYEIEYPKNILDISEYVSCDNREVYKTFCYLVKDILNVGFSALLCRTKDFNKIAEFILEFSICKKSNHKYIKNIECIFEKTYLDFILEEKEYRLIYFILKYCLKNTIENTFYILHNANFLPMLKTRMETEINRLDVVFFCICLQIIKEEKLYTKKGKSDILLTDTFFIDKILTKKVIDNYFNYMYSESKEKFLLKALQTVEHKYSPYFLKVSNAIVIKKLYSNLNVENTFLSRFQDDFKNFINENNHINVFFTNKNNRKTEEYDLLPMADE